MSKEEMKNKKEETYRKILDASWEIAEKEGLEALSIRKVATALKFAPNNLYNYFQNKNELLYQLKKDAYEWTFAVGLKDIQEGATIRETMENAIRGLMHIAMKEPDRYIIMTSDIIMDSEEPLDKQINAKVADYIRKGIEQGEFKQSDPQMTATNIRIALIAFIRWIAAHKQLTPEQADGCLDNFLVILFDGISDRKE